MNNTICAPNCEPSGHHISPLTLSWLLFYFFTTTTNGSKRSPLEKRPRHVNVTCARPWLQERTSTLGFSFLLFFLFFFVTGAKISLLSRIVCLHVSVNSGKYRSIRMSLFYLQWLFTIFYLWWFYSRSNRKFTNRCIIFYEFYFCAMNTMLHNIIRYVIN